MTAPHRVAVHRQHLPLALVAVGTHRTLTAGGEHLGEVGVIFAVVIDHLLSIIDNDSQAILGLNVMGPVRVDVIVEDIIATHRQQANQHQ